MLMSLVYNNKGAILGMVVTQPRPQVVEVEKPQVWGQSVVHSKTLFLKVTTESVRQTDGWGQVCSGSYKVIDKES